MVLMLLWLQNKIVLQLNKEGMGEWRTASKFSVWTKS